MDLVPALMNAAVIGAVGILLTFVTRTQIKDVKADVRDLKDDLRDLKDDLRDVKQDLRDLRTEVGALRSDLTHVALASRHGPATT